MTDISNQPQKNWLLLWKTFDFIKEHPELHEQSCYVRGEVDQQGNLCGTTACFAGWAVQFSLGDRVTFRPCTIAVAPGVFEYANQTSRCSVDGGFSRPISEVAQEELGLGYNEATNLFLGGNTIEDIERLLQRWERAEAAE